MKSEDYWKDRFEKLEAVQYAKAKRFDKYIEKEFSKALQKIEKDIAYWYSRFAKDNEISFSEAKRMLTNSELKAFKMSVEEYIKKGESLDPQWRDELEKASVKFHVSRLEALKVQIRAEIEALNGLFAQEFDTFGLDSYKEQYYRTVYEVQKGLRVGFDVAQLDRNQVFKVIRKPWASDGRNFSERVWSNRTKLVNELHTTLTQSIMRGEAPDKAISAISKRMDVSKSNAGRLIMTESAFFASASRNDAYKTLDVEEFKFLATLDSHTSDICRATDGKVFDQRDYQIGVNAPPLHPRCRSVTIPYFEDLDGMRASRVDGEYKLVPDTMTYEEWKSEFVDGGDKALSKAYGEEHVKSLNLLLKNNASEDLRNVWGQYEKDLRVNDANYTGGAHFSSYEGGIKLNLELDAKGSSWSKPYQTTFHEFGHQIDFLANGRKHGEYYSTAFEGGVFPQTIYAEVKGWLYSIEKRLKEGFTSAKDKGQFLADERLINEWEASTINRLGAKWSKRYAYKALQNELMRIDMVNRSALSDIIEGVTKAKVSAGFGHGAQYWRDRPYGVENEAFAEFWECVANPSQWETIKKHLPKSVAVFERMIKELVKNG